MHMMTRRIAALAASAAIFAAAPAIAPVFHDSPVGPATVIAKTCSAGFHRAVINGSQKCLRRGEFCAHAADDQYRRYGFRCTKFDRRVDRYRLS
jgi:hypothetical protein